MSNHSFGVPCHGVKCRVATPLTWKALNAFLGEALSRDIGSNTEALRLPNGDIGIRYYATTVLRYHYAETPDQGKTFVTFNAGGYMTISTGHRFKWALGQLYAPFADRSGLANPASRVGAARYYDGATFDYRRGVIVARTHKPPSR